MRFVEMWYIEGLDAGGKHMQTTFDICPMVRKYSAIPCEQIQVIRDITAFQLSKIARGIVLIFAAWSGHSVIALQRLTDKAFPGAIWTSWRSKSSTSRA